jgi:hypothetical protein
MFGKMKQWFGIEGVKLELLLPEAVDKSLGEIEGQLRFTSMTDQQVSSAAVRLVERYSRGRGKEKLVDEYMLGEITLHRPVEVPANAEVFVRFKLPFALATSEIDEMGARNILLKGVAGIAKSLRAVKSEYRVEAEAKVQGTRLHPIDKKPIKIL